MDDSASSNQGEKRPKKKIKIYDFEQPKLVSKDIIRAMRNIHETYGRHIKRVFSGVLNHPVEVTLAGVSQVVFSKFLQEIESPTAIFMFNVEELGDWALLQVQPEFCIYCVERQSGGYKNEVSEKRSLSRIEERIIGRVINNMLKELSHVWSPFLSFTIEDFVYESKPENIRTMSAIAPGILIDYELKFDKFVVPFSICYPPSLLKDKPIGSTFNLDKSSANALPPADKKKFEDDMKRVEVNFRAVLGTTMMSVMDLMALREGDTLLLDQQIEEALNIKINDKVKMNGYPGRMNGKKAVKIYEIIKNSNEHFDF
ncbi:MAG: FliM/FliN family flagellar motor switch protein [Balneolales bacterium]